MKNPNRRLLALVTIVANGVFAAQANAQIAVSESDQVWVDLAETAAGEVPFIGPLLSPIVGLSFTEKDQIKPRLDALRNELEAYTDMSVLEEDKRLKEDILKGYTDDLRAVENAKDDPIELFPHLRFTEANMNRHFDSFESKGDEKATRNLLFMTTQAQIHLQVLTKILALYPDSPFWNKHANYNRERYHDYATSQVEKVVKERLKQIGTKQLQESYDVEVGGLDLRTTLTKYRDTYVLADRAPENFLSGFPGAYSWRTVDAEGLQAVKQRYSAMVEAKTRRFWDQHLGIPVFKAVLGMPASTARLQPSEFYSTNLPARSTPLGGLGAVASFEISQPGALIITNVSDTEIASYSFQEVKFGGKGRSIESIGDLDDAEAHPKPMHLAAGTSRLVEINPGTRTLLIMNVGEEIQGQDIRNILIEISGPGWKLNASGVISD